MYEEVVQNLSVELDISVECAADVFYLRSRRRWSEQLESELIELHDIGKPPNIYDFGCTRETGEALLKGHPSEKESISEPDKDAVKRAARAFMAGVAELSDKFRTKKDNE